MKKDFLIIGLFLTIAITLNTQNYDFTKFTGPYLGQKPPGKYPERFAPDYVCTHLDEFGCTFSPDGKQFYFTRTTLNPRQHKIFVIKLEESGWSQPFEVQFTGDFSVGEPQFSPDGNDFFFGRLEEDENKNIIPVIWKAPYQNGQIGKPEKLFSGMYATAAKNGNLYYTDVSYGMDKGDIVVSRTQGKNYLPAKSLDGGINSAFQDAHPFIAGDESYIIFDSNRPGGLGDNDLYICFRTKVDSWGEAINLGNPINSGKYDAIPYVSPDGKYLFFCRSGDIYWVDAGIIEELKDEMEINFQKDLF